jgi:tape measure domain-containing protein
MARMSLDTAIRLSAEVKGGANITKVQRSLQDLAKGSQTTAREMSTLRAATFQYARANDGTIAGIRNSVNAFRGLQEQARIGSREYNRYGAEVQKLEAKLAGLNTVAKAQQQVNLSSVSAIRAQVAALRAQQEQAVIGSAAFRQYAAEAKRLESVLASLSGKTRAAAASTAPYAEILNRLGNSSRLSNAELGKLNIAINRTARESGNSTSAIRQQIGALEALRGRVDIGSGAYKRLGVQIDELKSKLRGLDSTAEKAGASLGQKLATGLAAGLATLGAGRAIGSSLSAVVASEESERRLRSLSQGLDDYSRVQAAATAAAEKFGTAQTQANQEFAQIYARLRPIGLTLEEVSTVYNGFNTAAKLSGTTSTEASAAFLQLSQALGTGVLRGEELNSVFEQTPAVVQSIAQVMGVPIGQIRELAKEGKITGDIVLTALGQIERDGAPKLAEAMKGPAQQFKNLQIAGQQLQIELGEALLPTALATANAATRLLQEINKLPDPVKNTGIVATGAAIGIASMATAINAIGGITAATTALKAYTASAAAAGTATAAAATKTTALLGVLTRLGKIGLVVIGVKFAIEGLDDLITGLVGVKRAEAASRAMAERRGLTYVPSAAVTRRNQAASAYVSPFAGARDKAFALAQQIQPGQPRPGAAVPLSVTPAPTAGGGGGGGSGKGKAEKDPSIEERIAARPFGREILAAARANNVDAALFAALVEQESGNRQSAISRSGAIGLSQLMPGTARELGVNPRDPMQNLMGGAKYLRQQLDRFGLEGGLRAYNQGPGAQQRTPGGNSQESREYPGRVLDRYRKLTGEQGNVEGLNAEGFQSQQQAMQQLQEQQEAAQKQLEEYFNTRAKIAVQLNQEEDLLRATTDEQRRQLEYEYEIEDINERNLQAKNDLAAIEAEITRLGGIAETAAINQRLENEKQQELVIARLKYEQDMNDLLVERVRMMQQLSREAAEAPAFQTQGMAIEEQIATLKGDLAEMTSISTLAAKSAEGIGSAFGNAFQELISGAASAREVLAGFFQDVAKGFAQMAAEIIAKQMTMIVLQTILKALGAAVGGGAGFAPSGPLESVGSFSPSLSFDPSGLIPRAIGGPTAAGQPYKVGERGPELFVPYQAGTIIPAETTEALEAINNARMQPLAVPFQRNDNPLSVPFLKSGGGADGAAAGGATIDVKFETVRIGEMDFVTRDEAQRIGRESAKQGAALAQKRLANNPTARRAVGLG